MTHHTQFEDNLGGVDSFREWKYKISPILEENELDQVISGDVPEPKGYEVKDTHKRSMNKRIIVDSIKEIPHVSIFKTPKEVYDALTKMFEGKNINQNMNLRNQLNNVKIQNSKNILSYFTRVAQIK